MSSAEVTPTGGVPGAESEGRPKTIACPCCESVIFRNGELKKKGSRMIELEKAETENERLHEQVTALQDAARDRRIETPETPITPETPAIPAATPKRKGFLVHRED